MVGLDGRHASGGQVGSVKSNRLVRVGWVESFRWRRASGSGQSGHVGRVGRVKLVESVESSRVMLVGSVGRSVGGAKLVGSGRIDQVKSVGSGPSFQFGRVGSVGSSRVMLVVSAGQSMSD